jgi:hypothetical protein
MDDSKMFYPQVPRILLDHKHDRCTPPLQGKSEVERNVYHIHHELDEVYLSFPFFRFLLSIDKVQD